MFPKEILQEWTSQVYLRQGDYKVFTKYPDGKDLKLIVENVLKPNKKVQIAHRVFGQNLSVQALWNGEKFILPYMLLYHHNRMFTKNFGYPTAKTGAIGLWIGGKSPFGTDVLAAIKKPDEPTNVLVEFIWQQRDNKIWITDVDYGAISPFFQLYKTLVKSDFEKLYQELNPKVQDFKFYRSAGCSISVFLPEGKKFKNSPIIVENRNLYEFIDFVGAEDMKAKNNPVFIISAFGNTPKQAEKRCYDNLRQVYLPNCFFRTDIGQSWFRTKYPEL